MGGRVDKSGRRWLMESGDEDDIYPLYGRPYTDDPRYFVPDLQVCTPSELEEWIEALHQIHQGETPDKGNTTVVALNEEGEPLARFSGTRWGVGTTYEKPGEEFAITTLQNILEIMTDIQNRLDSRR